MNVYEHCDECMNDIMIATIEKEKSNNLKWIFTYRYHLRLLLH